MIGFVSGLVGIIGWRQSRSYERESTLGSAVAALAVLVGVVVVVGFLLVLAAIRSMNPDAGW